MRIYTTWKGSAPEGGATPHFFVPERKKVILKALLRKAFKITFQVVNLIILSICRGAPCGNLVISGRSQGIAPTGSSFYLILVPKINLPLLKRRRETLTHEATLPTARDSQNPASLPAVSSPPKYRAIVCPIACASCGTRAASAK